MTCLWYITYTTFASYSVLSITADLILLRVVFRQTICFSCIAAVNRSECELHISFTEPKTNYTFSMQREKKEEEEEKDVRLHPNIPLPSQPHPPNMSPSSHH